MTEEGKRDTNGIISKTVSGILKALIPATLLVWGGTYIAVRVAIATQDQKIKYIEKTQEKHAEKIERLEEADYNIWRYMLENTVTRGGKQNEDRGDDNTQ